MFPDRSSRLDQAIFFRPSRSQLFNLRFVESAENDVDESLVVKLRIGQTVLSHAGAFWPIDPRGVQLPQLEVPDRFRGRVFAAELAMVTLMSSISSYWTGYELDRGGWSPQSVSTALGALFFIPGTLWLIILSRWQESAPVAAPSDHASGEEEVLEGRIG